MLGSVRQRVLGKCLSDRNEVLQRFGHFEPVDVQVPCMHEVRDPLVVAVVRLRLGQLVVVVRELEIDPTSVDVLRWRGGMREIVQRG